MSVDDKNKDGEIIEKEKFLIDVRRSSAEKELTDDVAKITSEKDRIAEQLDGLNTKLKELEEQMQAKDANIQSITAERDKALEEKDEYKDQITALTLEEFEKKKTAKKEVLLNLGMEEEKVNEMFDAIQSPLDMEKQQLWLNWTIENLEKGRDAEAEIEKKKLEEQQKLEAKKGTTVDSPPGGSQVTLETPPPSGEQSEYETYAEMIADLRERMAKGDEKALKEYNSLWEMMPEALKKVNPGFTLTACPRCDNGVYKSMTVCPWCRFDLIDFRAKGGELI